jgi:hypothetical protein
MYKLIGLFVRIGSEGGSLLSCCGPNITYDNNEILSLIRHSGIKPNVLTIYQYSWYDLRIEDIKVLRKEYRLKKKFNSKRVWILDIGSKWTFNNNKF